MDRDSVWAGKHYVNETAVHFVQYIAMHFVQYIAI